MTHVYSRFYPQKYGCTCQHIMLDVKQAYAYKQRSTIACSSHCSVTRKPAWTDSDFYWEGHHCMYEKEDKNVHFKVGGEGERRNEG